MCNIVELWFPFMRACLSSFLPLEDSDRILPYTNPRFIFAYFLPTKVGFLQGDTKLLAFLPIFGDSWQMGQVSEWQIVADGDFPNADQKVI